MPIPVVECSGTPYEIGYTHGASAKSQIASSIAFYAKLFKESSNKDWDQVRQLAEGFGEVIRKKWPDYWDEMRGISAGSIHPLPSILALNVRTEITFGLFSPTTVPTTPTLDGCTSLSLTTPTSSFLGQNWDWSPSQRPSLIALHITPLPPKPALKILTEAGIIGKIGLNAAGVGVCFNAIRARGMDPTRMPAHLGLRRVLECGSAEEAVQALQREGMASSAFVLVADAKGGIGLEFSSRTFARLEGVGRLEGEGQGVGIGRVVAHSNHLLGRHPGVVEPPWLADSCARVERVRGLAGEKFGGGEVGCGMGEVGGMNGLEGVGGGQVEGVGGSRQEDATGGAKDGIGAREKEWAAFSSIFEDHEGAPGSICRTESLPQTSSETLFNIVMEFRGEGGSGKPPRPRAVVRMGRPCMEGEVLEFMF